MDEAGLCDETLLLNEGRLLFAGKPQDLSARVRNRVFRIRGYSALERRRVVTNLSKNAEVVGDPTEINSYMGFAIFTTLCCSLPTGIVAIIFASMVSQQIQAGNYEQAQKYSNLAKTFCWISVILGLFCCGGTSILNSFGEAASAAAGAVSP